MKLSGALRTVLAGLLVTAIVLTIELPLAWLFAVVGITLFVLLAQRGHLKMVVKPLTFWQVAPLALGTLVSSLVGLLAVIVLAVAGKPLTYSYLLFTVFLLLSYQLFTTNRGRWFGISESETVSAARRRYILTEAVLADGRVAALAKTNLWRGEFILPGAVRRQLDEPQTVVALQLRQQRAKSTLLELAHQHVLKYRVDESSELEPLEYAQTRKAVLLTCEATQYDEALRKKVAVVWLKDLEDRISKLELLDEDTGLPKGNPLKAGDTISVLLRENAQEPRQALGHLDDGTPVLVDDAAELIGQRVSVVIRSINQAGRGRVLFGYRADKARSNGPTR